MGLGRYDGTVINSDRNSDEFRAFIVGIMRCRGEWAERLCTSLLNLRPLNGSSGFDSHTLRHGRGAPNGKEPVLKTGARKGLQVRLLSPPLCAIEYNVIIKSCLTGIPTKFFLRSVIQMSINCGGLRSLLTTDWMEKNLMSGK